MKRINVLCAVRDSLMAENLRRQMDERYLFETVRSGETALLYAVRRRPDILIVDAVLPYLDGVGLVERLHAAHGERMPEVIGGSVLSFSDEAFRRLGVSHVARVPWNRAQIMQMLEEIVCKMDTQVDWEQAGKSCLRVKSMLRGMGMNEHLRGFEYLAWAASLAGDNEDRLQAVRERLYVPVAERFGTTPQSVERLIRHAVERTADTVGAQGIYTFFGNTIDPMRGKPTNAQMIGMLGERLRIS